MAEELGKIEKVWEEFEAAALSSNASDRQRGDIRDAFYAGALAFFNINLEIIKASQTTGNLEAALRELHNVGEELDNFIAQVSARNLKH